MLLTADRRLKIFVCRDDESGGWANSQRVKWPVLDSYHSQVSEFRARWCSNLFGHSEVKVGAKHIQVAMSGRHLSLLRTTR